MNMIPSLFRPWLMFALALLALAGGARAQTMIYDAAGRLSAVKNASGQLFYYEYDGAGNLLGVGTNVVPPVTLSSPQSFSVDSPVNLDITGGQPVGAHTYYATGLPAGLKINPVTGQITGTITGLPGTYTIHYWSQAGAQHSLTQTLTATVGAFPSVFVGAADGLLVDVNDGTPAGRMTVTVTTKGAFTAQLAYNDGHTYPLAGQLTLQGVPGSPTEADATMKIARAGGLTPLTVALRVRAQALAVPAFDVSIKAGIVAAATTGDSHWRGLFTKTSPALWAGVYTLTLKATGFAPDSPQGAGYASVAVTGATGVLSLTGKLADGKVITNAVYASGAGEYLVYFNPYTQAGSYLSGGLTVLGGPPPAAYNGSGAFTWKKTARAADTSYAAGFTPVPINPAMQQWTPPASGIKLATALGLPAAGTFGATIQGYGLDNTAPKTLVVPVVPGPQDNFASRGAIPPGGGASTGSNAGFTKEVGEPNHDGDAGGESAWWTWTPAVDTSVTISSIGSTFDTVLAVYTGDSLATLVQVAADDDSGGSGTSRLSFNAVGGTAYQIALDGYGSTENGSIVLTVSPLMGGSSAVNSYGVPAWLALTTSSKATTIGTTENSSSKLTGSVNPATGVFTGSFAIKDVVTVKGKPATLTRVVAVGGIFTTPGLLGDLGAGFFLLPPIGSWDSTHSGIMTLNTTPPRAAYP